MLLLIHRHLHETAKTTKNQGNITPIKKYSKLPVTDTKKWKFMNVHELAEKIFKITVPKMLREQQENTDKTIL